MRIFYAALNEDMDDNYIRRVNANNRLLLFAFGSKCIVWSLWKVKNNLVFDDMEFSSEIFFKSS